MSTPFHDTVSAIRSDGTRLNSLALLACLLGLVALVIWGLEARVRVFEVSVAGRLQSRGDAYHLHARDSGLLVQATAELGDRVRVGQSLFEFDTRELKQRQRHLEGELERLPSERAAIEAEHRAWTAVMGSREALTDASLRSAQVRRRTARELLELSGDELQELSKLAAQGVVSWAEVRALKRDHARASGDVEGARRESEVLRSESKLALGELSARVASLEQRRLDALRREAQLKAELADVELAIERSQIKAPISGRIGDRSPRSVGAWVELGQHLATIVPEGQLRCVAYFAPDSAVGRIAIGQPATLRLDGFSWARFGTLAAKVEKVSRPDPGKAVQVVLRLDPEANQFPVALQHGMMASVEVEVERARPFELLLRAAGLALVPGRQAPIGGPGDGPASAVQSEVSR